MTYINHLLDSDSLGDQGGHVKKFIHLIEQEQDDKDIIPLGIQR